MGQAGSGEPPVGRSRLTGRACDEVNPTGYTAETAHGLTPSTPGHLGMQVHNLNGADAKTIQYDNVLLTPEPVTPALLSVGGLVVAKGRRRGT